MQTYRYKVQTGGFGLFLGLAAETARLTTPPAPSVSPSATGSGWTPPKSTTRTTGADWHSTNANLHGCGWA